MNKHMKRVSRKALSAIVALAIVLSCVAVSFSVFAAGSTYLVKSSEPVIPMYVNKAIDLASLNIEIGDTTKLGSELNWTAKNGVSANVNSGKLIGVGKGRTRFTLTDGAGNSQNVWVFVNKQGDNDFTLLYNDFNDPSTYNLYDWIGTCSNPGWGLGAAGKIYTHGSYGIYPERKQPSIVAPNCFDENQQVVTRQTLKIGAPDEYAGTYATFYKSEVLKDFANYTLEVNLGNVIVNKFGEPDVYANCITAASGIFVRTTLSDAAYQIKYDAIPDDGPMALVAGTKSLHLRFRNYGGMMLSAYDTNGTNTTEPRNFLYGDSANMYYTGNINPDDLWVGNDKTKTLTPAPQNPNTETIRNIKIQLKDTGIKYTLDGNVIFDTIANNDVKGMYTPVTEAGETGHTEDDGNYMSHVYWNKGYPSTYTNLPTISHADYEKYYKECLQAEKGTFGFSNGAGTLTHIYTVKVNVGGIDPENMPEMTDIVAAKVFEVSASSPAIPLYVGKGINLSLINIGIGEGTATGDQLTWKRFSGTAAKIQGDYLVGASEGLAGFTVTDGVNSQNVWAIVNKIGDDDFSLVNFDFANGDTFNPNDWITGQFELTATTYHSESNGRGGNEGYKKIGGLLDRGDYKVATNISDEQATPILSMASPTVKTQSGVKPQNALYLASPTKTTDMYVSTVAFYKSEMMKDFIDYSISADISLKMEGADTQHALAAPGIVARAQVDNNAKTGEFILDDYDKSYMFRFRNYGTILINSVNSTNYASHHEQIDAATDFTKEPLLSLQWETSFLGMTASTCYFTKGLTVTSEDQLYKDTAKKEFLLYPDAKSASELTMRKIKIDLGDKDIRYTLDSNVILDTFTKKPNGRLNLSYFTRNPFVKENELNDQGWTEYAKLWGTNINVVNGGTVGLSNTFGEGMYVYSLKVEAKNILEAENMPEYEDVEVVPSYTVPVNTRFNLNNLKDGATWKDATAKEYEVKNGVLMAFAVPRKDISVETTGGEKFTVKISEAGSSTDYEVTTFAPDQVVIAPNTRNPGEYTAKINNKYDISIGSFVLKNAVAKTETQLLDADDDGKGTSYTFTTNDMANSELSAKFISEADAVQEIKILGATIKTETGNEGLRFRTRIPAIRTLALYADTLTRDGASITLENVGVLLIPKDLIGTVALRSGLNADFDAATTERVKVNGHSAINVPIVNLAKSNAKYSDAWATINYAASETEDIINRLDVDIATISYIQYRDASGNVGFICSDEVVRSYNGVLSESAPQ